MKKFFLTFFVATFFATAIFSQTPFWLYNTYGVFLYPHSGSVGIGTGPLSLQAKLSILQSGGTNTDPVYGLYSITQTDYANSTETLYGAYLGTAKTNAISSGNVYGLFTNTGNMGTGTIYGIYSSNINSNTSAGDVYGSHFYCQNSNPNGKVYGLISQVHGGQADSRYAAFFVGGKVTVMNGSVGIGTQTPKAALHVQDGNFLITNGYVGFGTDNPTVKLDVVGIIRAHEVKVCLNQGCDFVFDKDYKLMPLQDLSSFIDENKHLPEIAPAAEMENEGINLSEMNAKLLQKVEELTLYLIQQNKEIENLKAIVNNLENK